MTPRIQKTRRFMIVETHDENATVRSFTLEPEDHSSPGPFEPGQFVRVGLPGSDRLCLYSLSDRPGKNDIRITVKRIDGGTCSVGLHNQLQKGSRVEVSEPTGEFRLDLNSDRPIVLVSAGVGVTPLMSMLEHLVAIDSKQKVIFVHAAQNGSQHIFRDRMREIARIAPQIRFHIAYSRPELTDRAGIDYQSAGRIGIGLLRELQPGTEADYYLCGPAGFLEQLSSGLLEFGIPECRIRMERFTTLPQTQSIKESVSSEATVVFRQSGVTVSWDPRYQNLLELAEANGVPRDYYCRAGICKTCQTTLLSGSVEYTLPLSPTPPPDLVLICCARPKGPIELDA